MRNGTANLFIAFEPLGGWRAVAVTDRRRREDWARFVRDLVDGRYREADKLVLVMDQLNTHSPASLYEAFAPEEAKRVADRLEIHNTPKHGSWLNMAEIELSALGRDPGLRRGRLCRTGSTTGRRWSATSRLGSTGATPPTPGPIGSSLPRTPASSSVNSTRQRKNDRALVRNAAGAAHVKPALAMQGLHTVSPWSVYCRCRPGLRLGGVDGFDQDERARKRDEGGEVLRGFLAA